MSERTLYLDNTREAQELLGRQGRWISRLESGLGVTLVHRDTWIRIEGTEENVDRASAFIESIRLARNRGAILREQGILYALQAYREGRQSEWDRLHVQRIDVAAGRPAVFARTFGQMRYVDAIRQHDFVFGIGPAGTGKTYLAMAMAVSSLLRGEVSRIILTRPAVEAGENLGYLPGDLQEKVFPYLRPLYDALYDMMAPEEIEQNRSRGVIEVAPLAYMRGRTLNHAFVILDEAQNTTPEQMLMFLTRMGFDSKCVVTGDLSQVDLPSNKRSGLAEADRTLARVDGIALIHLGDEDVVRHALVQKIIQAYRQGREEPPRAPSA